MDPGHSDATSDISESDLNKSFDSVAVNAFDLYESVFCQYANGQDNLTFEECLTIIQDKIKKAILHPEFRAEVGGPTLPGTTLLNEFVSGPDCCEIYVNYEGVQPILKQVEKEIVYESITKYSYLDENKTVKIYLPMEGIGSLPKENIHSRFLDRSVEIKVHDYLGKNWIFAVPKTQCQILIKNCKVTQKQDKLIVTLGKFAEKDNWFTLHKTRCIGEKELD